MVKRFPVIQVYRESRTMRISMLLACSIFGMKGLVFGQDGLIDIAKQHANSFSLDAEFGLPEYRMVAEIEVESTPDSALLFSSRASMEVVQIDSVRFERFDINPKIIADDRISARNEKGGVLDLGPFARIERWERLHFDDKVFDLLGGNGVRAPLNGIRQVHPVMLRLSTTCVKPFDWPIHTPGAFAGGTSEKDLYKLVFGEDRACVFAKGTSEDLETHWTKIGAKISFVRAINFKDGLPVLSQLYVFREMVDPKDYDLRKATRLITTETKWDNYGGMMLPKAIVSEISGVGQDRKSLIVLSNLKFYKEGDKSFEERKAELSSLVNAIRDMK